MKLPDISELNLAGLHPDERRRALRLWRELQDRKRYRQFYDTFPDAGELSRDKYPRHMAFFKAGKHYKERVFMAANRVGKTVGGGFETVCHLIGEYPDWWEGRVFHHPVTAMVAGETITATRDVLQKKLIGSLDDPGTGLIPKEAIVKMVRHPSVRDCLDYVDIKHISGQKSRIYFRGYDQGRRIFQGFELHIWWPDEECPPDVYAEGLTRTMTTGGISYCTFTPLMGLTQLIKDFMSTADKEPLLLAKSRAVISATWDDVPHLSKKDKDELLAGFLPHQRDARSKGIPSLGAGAIYPIPESEFVVEPFTIPAHWPRAYGLDVGWRRTAGIWGALDRDNDVLYLYTEHYRGMVEPAVHAAGIKARGKWIRGAIDPAARISGQKDGEKLLELYRNEGLLLTKADNAVEAGIYNLLNRISTGRLKVWSTCQNWLSEFRLYRRNEAGKIVKEDDHLMDATRYLNMMLMQIAKTEPAKQTHSAPSGHHVQDSLIGY